MDVLFFRSLARAQTAEASSAVRGVAQRSYFELLSQLFQAEVHVRILWSTRTFSFFLHDENEALRHYQARHDKISQQQQEQQLREAEAEAAARAQQGKSRRHDSRAGSGGAGTSATASAAAWRRIEVDGEPQVSSRLLRLRSIVELESTGIQMQITLKDSRKEVLLSADTVLILDRFSPSSPCRRCLESVCDTPLPPTRISSVSSLESALTPSRPLAQRRDGLSPPGGVEGEPPSRTDSTDGDTSDAQPPETSGAAREGVAAEPIGLARAVAAALRADPDAAHAALPLGARRLGRRADLRPLPAALDLPLRAHRGHLVARARGGAAQLADGLLAAAPLALGARLLRLALL
eukprot:6694826-Prymnesium_polylepis.1